jgi:beta-glucanase (GH16 family)
MRQQACNRLSPHPFSVAACALLVCVGVVTIGRARGQAVRGDTGWTLVWSDEFDGAPGSRPDSTKWTYDIGDGAPRTPGWGNYEQQIYTDRSENASQDGSGHLVIRATRTKDGFLSSRIKTQDRFTFVYGKVEARIKIPYGRGIWPAFWMLGASHRFVAWPICGEIDIMENFGERNNDASRIHGTVQGPGYAGTGLSTTHSLPQGRMADDYHVFGIEWAANSIEFFVDGQMYYRVTPSMIPDRSQWVFNDSPFFLILNLAVGGYPAPVGYPDDTTSFPQEMLVDYVRVYQRQPSNPR